MKNNNYTVADAIKDLNKLYGIYGECRKARKNPKEMPRFPKKKSTK